MNFLAQIARNLRESWSSSQAYELSDEVANEEDV